MKTLNVTNSKCQQFSLSGRVGFVCCGYGIRDATLGVSDNQDGVLQYEVSTLAQIATNNNFILVLLLLSILHTQANMQNYTEREHLEKSFNVYLSCTDVV